MSDTPNHLHIDTDVGQSGQPLMQLLVICLDHHGHIQVHGLFLVPPIMSKKYNLIFE